MVVKGIDVGHGLPHEPEKVELGGLGQLAVLKDLLHGLGLAPLVELAGDLVKHVQIVEEDDLVRVVVLEHEWDPCNVNIRRRTKKKKKCSAGIPHLVTFKAVVCTQQLAHVLVKGEDGRGLLKQLGLAVLLEAFERIAKHLCEHGQVAGDRVLELDERQDGVLLA